MPVIKVRDNEPFEVAMKRFKKQCEKAGILSELKRREYYDKPSVRRKKKAAAARKRALKKHEADGSLKLGGSCWWHGSRTRSSSRFAIASTSSTSSVASSRSRRPDAATRDCVPSTARRRRPSTSIPTAGLLLLRLPGGRQRLRLPDEDREPDLPRGGARAGGASAASRSRRAAAASAALAERLVRGERGRAGGYRARARASPATRRSPTSTSAASTPPRHRALRHRLRARPLGHRGARAARARHPGASSARSAGLLARARARRPLRSPARPRHVPDPGHARPHHRLRRPRARRGPGAEVPEHAREPDLPQARGASTASRWRSMRSAAASARSSSRATSISSRCTARASRRRSPPAAPRSAPSTRANLRRRTRDVVLLFDGDEAGQRAMQRALEVLLPEGLRVRAAVLPAGEDPDSFLRARAPRRCARSSTRRRRRSSA